MAERRERHQIPIYRWLCPSCRRTVSVVPDFLRPYAHFVSGLRERAVRRRLHGGRPWRELVRAVSSEAVGLVSEKTLRRWVPRARQLAGTWSTHLTEWLLRVAPALDPFALVARREGPDARLHYLLTLGGWLRRHLRSPATDDHPGLFAFLSRFHGLPAHKRFPNAVPVRLRRHRHQGVEPAPEPAATATGLNYLALARKEYDARRERELGRTAFTRLTGKDGEAK